MLFKKKQETKQNLHYQDNFFYPPPHLCLSLRFQNVPGKSYALLPFKKTSKDLSSADSESDSELKLASDSDLMYCNPTHPLARRGPGAPPTINKFDPRVVELNAMDPMKTFSIGQVVAIRPGELAGSGPEERDGFRLGKLCEVPELKQGDTREEGEVYIGIHWYARKPSSLAKEWNHRDCKWEAQMSGDRPFIEAQQMKVVAFEVTLNQDGSLYKQTTTNLSYLNYYRRQWFQLDPEEWIG